MTTFETESRVDRLYNLLPVIYRMRDAEQGYPLQALLRVISEQVNVVEDDILQLYENWFIETAEQWAVPYIGDLVGYKPLIAPGDDVDPTTDRGREISRILMPRQEVANVIRYRRRKGTLALLDLLARDVADWPARAVEFFKLLGWTQNINHPHPERARTADLREMSPLELIDGPFDSLAHTVDVRRVNSHRRRGRYNIPSVGVFVWRLGAYSVSDTPAWCAEHIGPHCCTFSVLGQDAPLFIDPQAETDPTAIAEECNLPSPIRLKDFADRKEHYYGPDKSLAIWAEDWAGYDADRPLPASAIIPADLSDWQYVPMRDHVAVDPVLGRFVFPPGQLPRRGTRVRYHYGFSADMGGGEYDRPLSDPANDDYRLYRVGSDETFSRVGDALKQWHEDAPSDAVVEITDGGVYVEPISVEMQADQSLQLRAANRERPVIRLLDWQTDLPDALTVQMSAGSRFTLDGLMVTGRGVHFRGPTGDEEENERPPICPSQILIRHCTLVPGWGLDSDCSPQRPTEASLELFDVRARLRIEHSITGPIQINEDEVGADPIPVEIADSIVDATDPQREAIGAPGRAVAHAIATIKRCTVFGIVDLHAVELAENSIFMDCVNVARRQIGCMRFCYVPPGCRTPRRYRCQTDLVERAVRESVDDLAAQQAMIACERLRVRPQFTSDQYGTPGYAQLGLGCAQEIRTGADDESEIGAFHDLYQPQREANLQARLDENTPAGMDVGIIFAT
jgi:hypothetical protein